MSKEQLLKIIAHAQAQIDEMEAEESLYEYEYREERALDMRMEAYAYYSGLNDDYDY